MPAFTLSNPEQTHALGNASTHSLAWAAAIDNPREDNTGPSKLQDFLSQYVTFVAAEIEAQHYRFANH